MQWSRGQVDSAIWSVIAAARVLLSLSGTTDMLSIYLSADFGVERSVTINGLDSNAISSKLEELVKKGESMPR